MINETALELLARAARMLLEKLRRGAHVGWATASFCLVWLRVWPSTDLYRRWC